MPLIECTAGPVEITVAGTNFTFQRDKYGRFVSDVYNERHVECFLGSPLYQVVDAVLVEVEPQKAPDPIIEPKIEPTPPPAPVFTPPPPPAPVPPVVPTTIAAASLLSGSASGLTPPTPPVVALPPLVPTVPPIPPIVAAPLPNPAHGLTPVLPVPLGEKTATPSPKNRAARRRGK